MRNLFVAFVLSLNCMLLHAQSNKVLQVETYQLTNGLTILLNQDSTATKVFGAVLVNAGSKHEDPSATGMAHYLEHLLFKGTETLGTWDYPAEKIFLDSIRGYYDSLAMAENDKKRAEIQQTINDLAVKASKYGLPNELDKLLKSIGSSEINAFTTYDMTFYYNSFPSHEINRWLDIYATRFQNPVFRSFQSELEVVYEEKNRATDSFERRIFEKMMGEMFPNLPYGQWSILGTVEDLKNPSLNEMYDFFHKHYVPGNMALVLTGNFQSESIKPLIEQKFGSWIAKPVPQQELPEATPINGTKVVNTRMTPIRVGMLGFQTPPYNHPDRLAASICEFMLYNDGKTGTINQVDLEGKLLYTGAFPLAFNDVGAYMVFYVPKIIGQSLKKAESYMNEALDKLRNGKFTDQELAAAKKQVSRMLQENMENLSNRGILIGGAFNAGLTWHQVLTVPEKAEVITREEIIRVANQYYGKDHLKMISRTGFGKHNQLKKPPFKPVLADQSKQSSYAQKFEEMPALPFKPQFLDFEKDITRDTLQGGHLVIATVNPVNDLFSLEFQFKKGTIDDPLLEFVAKAANYSGTDSLKPREFRQAFASLGSQYQFYTTINTFTLKIEGTESTLQETLRLTQKLLQELKISENSIAALLNNEKAERRLEKRTPGIVASALLNYATYGENSYFCLRPKVKTLKRLKNTDLQTKFDELVNQFETQLLYSGKHSAQQLGQLINQSLSLPDSAIAHPYRIRKIQPVESTKILLIPNKKGVQSHIYFFQPTPPTAKEDYPHLTAFNEYFGGGFSGLITQEIREYRSLAYSTWGGVYSTPLKGSQDRFISYIGCQADKTSNAIEVMQDLIQNMPEKPERTSSLRQTLKQSVITDYPDFKNITDKILMLERMGYQQDPNQQALAEYDELQMKDIVSFYNDNIKGAPFIIAIYGDKRKMNLHKLKSIAPVKQLKLKDVISF